MFNITKTENGITALILLVLGALVVSYAKLDTMGWVLIGICGGVLAAQVIDMFRK